MKTNILLMLAFIGSCALQAQNDVIADQAKGAGYYGFNSSYATQGTPAGIFAADDFQLSGQIDIYSVKVYGFQLDGDLNSVLTGFSLYIYADIGGVPDGDPSQPGTGLFEIINVPVNHPALQHQSGAYDTFTLDINAYQGSPLTLQAGTYWIVAAPHLNLDASSPQFGFKFWNWQSMSFS